jgi:hypothetical protein
MTMHFSSPWYSKNSSKLCRRSCNYTGEGHGGRLDYDEVNRNRGKYTVGRAVGETQEGGREIFMCVCERCGWGREDYGG